jgi:serine/threonine-protein kinase
LQKDPADRFRNMAELAISLLPFAPLRALAVAEGSSSIRRAAIHAIGGGTDPNARLSGSMRISGSLTPVDPVVNSMRVSHSVATSPSLDTSSLHRRRGAGFVGAVLAVLAAISITAVVVRRPVPAEPSGASGSRGVAAAPLPLPLPAEPAPVAARPTVSADHGAWTESSAPGASDAPHANARPAFRPPVRVPAAVATKPMAVASHSAAPPKTSAPTADSTPPVSPSPPTRSRPDVGY